MAPPKKKSKPANKINRRSPRFQKKRPCPGLSFPVRKRAKVKRRTNTKSKTLRKPARSTIKRAAPKKPRKRLSDYCYFVRHVASTAKRNTGQQLKGPALFKQAAKCWKCLNKDQREDFKRKINRQPDLPTIETADPGPCKHTNPTTSLLAHRSSRPYNEDDTDWVCHGKFPR